MSPDGQRSVQRLTAKVERRLIADLSGLSFLRDQVGRGRVDRRCRNALHDVQEVLGKFVQVFVAARIEAGCLFQLQTCISTTSDAQASELERTTPACERSNRADKFSKARRIASRDNAKVNLGTAFLSGELQVSAVLKLTASMVIVRVKAGSIRG